MNFSRRIAPTVALVILMSTLTAAPIAFAANCRAGFVGPYGTACGGNEEQEPDIVTVTPKESTKKTSVTVVAVTDKNKSSLRNANPIGPALGLGRVIFNGAPSQDFVTKVNVTPKPGQVSEVQAVPGNPTSPTVSGFRTKGTLVEFRVEVSGVSGKTLLGFSSPIKGQVILPAITVAAGDAATFTLNEWYSVSRRLAVNSVVYDPDYSKGIVSQRVITIVGTGVAPFSTPQLTRRAS